MCEICKSMLAAEHTEQPGAELCPKCRQFPLDVDAPLDLGQWDYVAPGFRDAVESFTPATTATADPAPDQAPENFEDIPEVDDEELPADVDDESEEPVETCYHCYQADSELAEI